MTGGIKVYTNLSRLNSLSGARAEREFFHCSGSRPWARAMAKARPFGLLESMFDTGSRLWRSLPPEEQVAAIEAGKAQGISVADEESADFSEAANLYKQTFGFIFVNNDPGISATRLAEICRERLANPIEVELRAMVNEYWKLIEKRLTGLLE